MSKVTPIKTGGMPRWVEKNGTVGTHCTVCHRYLSGEPPQTCADCLGVIRAEKRAKRNARKAAKAVTG